MLAVDVHFLPETAAFVTAAGFFLAARSCRLMYSRKALSMIPARRCFSPANSSIFANNDSSKINDVLTLIVFFYTSSLTFRRFSTDSSRSDFIELIPILRMISSANP